VNGKARQGKQPQEPKAQRGTDRSGVDKKADVD
jgi:hypothetical protein